MTEADTIERLADIETGDQITVQYQDYPGQSPKDFLSGTVTDVTSYCVDFIPEDGSDDYWPTFTSEETDRIRVYADSATIHAYHPDRGTDDLTQIGQRAEVESADLADTDSDATDPEVVTDGGESPADVLENAETNLQEAQITFDDGDQITVQIEDRERDTFTSMIRKDRSVFSVVLQTTDSGTAHPEYPVETYFATFDTEGTNRDVSAVGSYYEDGEYLDTNPREIVAVELTGDQPEVMTDGGTRRVPEKGERVVMRYYSERAGRVKISEGEVDHASEVSSRVYDDDEEPEAGNGHMEDGIHGYVIEDSSGRKLSFNTASMRAGSFGEEQFTHLGDLVSIDFSGDAADPEYLDEIADSGG